MVWGKVNKMSVVYVFLSRHLLLACGFMREFFYHTFFVCKLHPSKEFLQWSIFHSMILKHNHSCVRMQLKGTGHYHEDDEKPKHVYINGSLKIISQICWGVLVSLTYMRFWSWFNWKSFARLAFGAWAKVISHNFSTILTNSATKSPW